MSDRVLIVGAGFSGATLARTLADAGQRVRLIDQRPHLAGNCHTERDAETGVMVHRYGPHIFHTDDTGVWDFANRFARLRPYRHVVRAVAGGQVYSLPINLHTINQVFGTALSPDEARAFVGGLTEGGEGEAQSFEDQALRSVGRRLYETFLKGYTHKQWGRDPAELPAAVLKRLPLRFSYDDSYFSHRHQGIPEDGYTAMVARMVDHPAIEVALSTPFDPAQAQGTAHVFWTGALDAWFGGDEGRLAYRTQRFERVVATGDAQGCAVLNHTDADTPWTRVTEFKHFTPWETLAKTVLYRETAFEAGPECEPYYPVRLLAERALLARYAQRARALTGITFVGRLGTYRYLDMDVSIREARAAAQAWLRLGAAMPAFAVDPVSETALV